MNTLLWILAATVIDGLIALVGIFSLFMKKKTFNKLIFDLVAFSAGALMAGGLFHLLLESLETLKAVTALSYLMAGFILFFVLERVLKWHHCHERNCKVHPMSSLILIGDGAHNFIDGLVIAASFIVGIPFGILTTAMIYMHEIPQELGNFGILIYSKMKKRRALLYNFLAQLTCVAGGILGYFLKGIGGISTLLIPFAAGGFIYISASDLIPELHKEADMRKSIEAFIFFLVGVGLMLATKFLLNG